MEREQLTAARQRLNRFTEHIPYPLTYVDRQYTLRFVNLAYQQAVGLPATDLIGRPIGEVRGAARWAEHKPYFDRALNGESVQYTRLVPDLPQGARWMRTSYVPDLDDGGGAVQGVLHRHHRRARTHRSAAAPGPHRAARRAHRCTVAPHDDGAARHRGRDLRGAAGGAVLHRPRWFQGAQRCAWPRRRRCAAGLADAGAAAGGAARRRRRPLWRRRVPRPGPCARRDRRSQTGDAPAARRARLCAAVQWRRGCVRPASATRWRRTTRRRRCACCNWPTRRCTKPSVRAKTASRTARVEHSG